MDESKLVGAPGAIRTPDPQIRRLKPAVVTEQEFCKSPASWVVTDQWVAKRVANCKPPPGPENETAADAGTSGGSKKVSRKSNSQNNNRTSPSAASAFALLDGGNVVALFATVDALRAAMLAGAA